MSYLSKLRTKATNVDFRSVTVNYDGDDYMIKQPSIQGRQKLVDNATIKGKDGADDALNSSEFLVWGVIENTYVPDDLKDEAGKRDKDAGKRIWNAEDHDVLMDQPAGSLIDKLGEALNKLSGDDEDKVKND